MKMVTLPHARYSALTYAVSPVAKIFAIEKEWYSDPDETVIGVLLLDRQDKDWSWLVLGRDVDGLFKAVETKNSVETCEIARNELRERMKDIVATGEHVFPQEAKARKNRILEPVVTPEKLHPNFRALITLDGYSPARAIIQEIAYAFVDVDGNYIREFQTTGFAARLWELYLFAFLHEQDFILNRECNRPDFCGTKFGFPLNIEACTVNETEGESTPLPRSSEEAVRQEANYMPIKYGSVLYGKMQKKPKYWEMEHTKNLPFALAIHDFHGGDSMVWSAQALDDYLYDLKATWHKDAEGKLHITETPIREHIWGEKRIPSGFFDQPDTENVSAVLFSNSATIAKFNRMGKLAGFGDPGIVIIREGAMHDPEPNATVPIPFKVLVTPETYSETWSDSIRVFFNPKATNPFPMDLLPGCSYHALENGRRISFLPDGFIHHSRTLTLQPKKSGETG
jgi:hypothetical protein